jgi:hypothetical protein
MDPRQRALTRVAALSAHFPPAAPAAADKQQLVNHTAATPPRSVLSVAPARADTANPNREIASATDAPSSYARIHTQVQNFPLFFFLLVIATQLFRRSPPSPASCCQTGEENRVP